MWVSEWVNERVSEWVSCTSFISQELSQIDTWKWFSLKCPLHDGHHSKNSSTVLASCFVWYFFNFNNLLTGDYNDYLSSSNHVDSATLPPAASFWDTDHADLPELFSKLGLGKYSDLFRQQEVSFKAFKTYHYPEFLKFELSSNQNLLIHKRNIILRSQSVKKTLKDTITIRHTTSCRKCNGLDPSVSHSDCQSISPDF